MRFHYLLLPLAAQLTAGIAGTVPNSSFEQTAPNSEAPAGWHLRMTGKPQTEIRIVESNEATDGRKLLRFTSKTPYDDKIFTLLFTRIPGLKAGQSGLVSFDARGTSGAQFSVICGEWSQRHYLRNLTPEWRRYSFPFAIGEKDLEADGNYTLRFCLQSESNGIDIDDLRLEPSVEIVSPANASNQRATILPAIENWRELRTIPANVSAFELNSFGRIAAGSTGDGPVFLFEIKTRNPQGKSGAGMYAADSVQLRLDPTFTFADGDRATDREFGFSPLPNGKTATWCWQLKRELSPDEAEIITSRTANGWFLAVRLNPALLPELKWNANAAFGFNAAINRLQDGRRECAELAPGILDGKSSRHNIAALRQNGEQILPDETVDATRFYAGTLFLSNFTAAVPWQFRVELTGADQQHHTIPIAVAPPVAPGELVIGRFRLELNAIPDGEFTARFFAGDRQLLEQKGRKADPAAGLPEALDEAAKRFATLQEQAKRHPASAEGRLYRRVMERQLALLKRDFSRMNTPEEKNFYAMRGRQALKELNVVLDEYERFLNRQARPASPVDTLKNQPKFAIGYGHFKQNVVNDMEHLPGFGANVIQIDLGPNAFFRNESDLNQPDFRVFDDLVGTALDRGAKYGLKVCVLLNPHYVPNWWRKKHPELMNPDPRSPFEPYIDWEHPEVKELIQNYLNVILPRLAAHPNRQALHSICLTNEVVYRMPKWDDPRVRRLFLADLLRQYGSLDAFNQAAGRQYRTTEELEQSSIQEDKALHFAFLRWKRERLAGFHRWMSEQVRAALPEVPQSTKIMVFAAMRPSRINDAVDPELFAEISDLNGNDNYMLFHKGGFIASWQETAMWHDLQYSFKPVPVFNSENHVITDGDYTPIPWQFFHTNIVQQAIHKTGAVATWVWMDIDYQLHAAKSSRDANIFHRPAGVYGQGRGALDVNRLGSEIERFHQAPPEVELLYSPASYLQNSHAYIAEVEALYEALSYAGFRVGFRSERQLGRGETGNAPLLILPEVRYLDRQALSGLLRYQEQGGRLFFTGEAPRWDEFGNPLNNPPTAAALPPLSQLATDRPVRLLTLHEDGNRGIPHQSVTGDHGQILLNVINYNFEARKIRLAVPPGSRIVDRLTEQPFPTEFLLEPLTPLLLEITQ